MNKRKPYVLKRFVKVLFVMLVILGVLVAGMIIWATSKTGSQVISKRAQKTIKKNFAVNVTFKDIDLSIFPTRLALKGLQIDDTKGRLHCTMDEGELALDPIDLIQTKITIDEIYLGQPSCKIKLDAAAIAEIKALQKKPKTQVSPTRLDLSAIPSFEMFALNDGHFKVTIDDPEGIGKATLSLTGFGFDITGPGPKIEVRALLKQALGSFDQNDISIKEKLSNFKLRAAVTPSGVDLRYLDFDLGAVNLQSKDVHIPYPLWPKGPTATSLKLKFPASFLKNVPISLPAIKGLLKYDGQIGLHQDANQKLYVQANGTAEITGAQVDDFVIGDLTGTFIAGEKGISFSDTVLKTATGALKLAGNIALDKKLSIKSTVRLQRIELAHLLENLTMSDSYLLLWASGQAKVKGQLNPLRLDVTTNLNIADHYVFTDSYRKKTNRDTILHLPKATVSGKLKINKKHLITKNLDVNFDDSKLSVDMQFNFGANEGWQLVARSEQFNIGYLKQIAGLDVAGKGKITCRINDPTYGDPKIVGSASFNDFQFAGFDFKTLKTGIRSHGTKLVFDGLTGKSKNSLYSSREVLLQFGTKDGLNIDTKIDVEKLSIAELKNIFHLDLSSFGDPKGTLTGRVALEYKQKPDYFKIEGNLDHFGLVTFGESFGPSEQPVDFIWNDGALTLNQFNLRKGNGTISITGSMAKDGALDFIGVARDIPLSAIDNPMVKSMKIDAKGQVFAIVKGTYDHPTGEGDIRLSRSIHSNKHYGPSHLSLTLKNNIVTGRGTLGGQLFTVEHGSMDFTKNRFSVEGFASNLDLLNILDINTQNKKITLNMTGEVALKGRLDRRPKLQGRAEFETVKFSVENFNFTNKKPLVINFKNGLMDINHTRFKGSKLAFDIFGKASFNNFNVSMEGLASLNALTGLVSGIKNSSGLLAFKAKAKGRWEKPSFSGEATVENAGLSINGLPHPIEELSGNIRLSSKMIRFSDFNAKCAGGDINLNGELGLSGFDINDYSFRIGADAIKLSLTDELFFTAGTDQQYIIIRPDKKRNLPKITGDIFVQDLRYTQDIKIVEMSNLSVDRLVGSKLRTTTPRLFDKNQDSFTYDINLHGNKNLVIRNSIVDANIKIDDKEEPLRLVGTNQTYGFLGRILGLKGHIRFAGKVFDVRHATVSFRDKLRPENPYFRVVADGVVRDWNITITAIGTPDEYEIKLTSQPYLSNEDIVFLLLTGMTKAEHAQYGSSGMAAIGAPILGDVSGDIIPVEVRIYSEYSEKAGADATRLSVGKWITQDVWTEFSSGVGQEREFEANVEYKINDNVSISVDYDNKNEQGNVGIDMKFRLDF